MPTTTTSPKIKFQHLCFVLAAVFILARLLIILTSVESVFQGEELHRGTVAKEWLAGFPATSNVSLYRPDPYSGGSLVISAVAAFYFSILGPTLFAFKLAPLTIAFALFLITLFFLRRFFSEKVAVFAGLALIFAPPGFVGLSLIGNGDHTESILLSMAMLCAFYEFMFKSSHRPVSAFLIGLFAAFGFWFIPTTLVTTGTILCCWGVLEQHSLRGRYGLIFLSGLLLGLIPWFFYNGSNDFSGLGILQLDITVKSLLVFVQFPMGFFAGVMATQPAIALSFIYTAVILIIVLFFLKQNAIRTSGEKVLFFLLYPVLHLIAASMSAYDFSRFDHFYISYRFLAPVYFFLITFAAVALSSLARPMFLLLPLLLFGTVGQASLSFREPFGGATRFQGYSYYDLGEYWAGDDSPPGILIEPQEIRRVFKGLDQRFFAWGYLNELDHQLKNRFGWISEFPEAERTPYLEAWGYVYGEPKNLDVPAIQEILKKLTSNEKAAFYRGLSMGSVANGEQSPERFSTLGLNKYSLDYLFSFELGAFSYVTQRRSGNRVKTQLDAEAEDRWFWRGVGKGAAIVCLYDVEPRLNFCFESIRLENSPYLDDLYWGIGWGIREDWKEDRSRALSLLGRFPEEIQLHARQGFDACEKWYHLTPQAISG